MHHAWEEERGMEGKKEERKMGRWWEVEGMEIDTIYHQQSGCQALCQAPYQLYLMYFFQDLL